MEKSYVVGRACVVLLAVFLGACASPPATRSTDETGSATPSVVASATVWRYETPTATLAIEPESPAPRATQPPLPSPTPFEHEIVANDTLLGVALRYGLTLDELLAANPGVDPRVLSIGQKIIIPTGEGEGLIGLATPTPVAVSLRETDCYTDTLGGLRCFVLVDNRLEDAVENVVALVHLYSEAGELLESLQASAPLNLVPPDRSIPLMAYFAPPVPAGAFTQAHLLTALTVISTERYLSAKVEEIEVSTSEDGLAAQVSGEVVLTDGAQEIESVWVAVVAYDEGDGVVGVRRWESDPVEGAVEGVTFELTVFSSGGSIARVEALVEARPAGEPDS